jgi:aerobic C4-dicarboxylate transport protein
VGGKALIYFELVSTLALAIGLLVGNFVKPGSGFNINPATLDCKAVESYAGRAKAQSVADFLMHIVPNTVIDAFAKGDILQVLPVAVLFGLALSMAGPRGKPIINLVDALTHAVFGCESASSCGWRPLALSARWVYCEPLRFIVARTTRPPHWYLLSHLHLVRAV